MWKSNSMPVFKSFMTNELTEPRRMMLAAGLFVLLGLVVGFAQSSANSQREMALRLGPPAPVQLQDVQSRNIGPAGEVTIWAEADLDAAVILKLRGPDKANRALVTPLFPMSNRGASVLQGSLISTDPVAPRVSNGLIRRDVPALGVLLHILPPEQTTMPDVNALLGGVFGYGDHGAVVELNGLQVDAYGYEAMIDGAFAAKGADLADRYLAVAPFAGGREAAFAAQPVGSTPILFFIGALLLAGIAGLGFLRERAREARETRRKPKPQVQPVQTRAARSHPAFEAIASQEEISSGRSADVQPESKADQVKAWLREQARQQAGA